MDESGMEAVGSDAQETGAPADAQPAAEPEKKKKFGWKDAIDAVKKGVPVP